MALQKRSPRASPKPYDRRSAAPSQPRSMRRRPSPKQSFFSQQMRYTLLGVVLVIMTIVYVQTAAHSTRNSDFYKRTVALMEYKAGRGPAPDMGSEDAYPPVPLHRAGGLHWGDHGNHETSDERHRREVRAEIAREERKQREEERQQRLEEEDQKRRGGAGKMNAVHFGDRDDGSGRKAGPDLPLAGQQHPVMESDETLRERLREAEQNAKKNADERYRALKDIEAEVEKDREARITVTANVAEEVVAVPPKQAEDTSMAAESPVRAQSTTARKVMDDAEEPREDEGVKAEIASPVAVTTDAAGKGMPDKAATSRAAKKDDEEEQKQDKLREIYAEILSRSPVTIFSKSYCPHSAKAKNILLKAHTITPTPYVVELDKHPQGPDLQNLLLRLTSRRTVPNILISGKSLGGGDETEMLWQAGEIPARLRQMGGRRIRDVRMNYKYGEVPGGVGKGPHAHNQNPLGS